MADNRKNISTRNSAKSQKNFYVSKELPLIDGENFIKKSSTVNKVKVIAVGEKIRDIKRLVESYPLPNGTLTKPQDWYKCRGTAIITNSTRYEVKEIHWYQCKNIGKVEFKIKVRDADNIAKV